MKFFLPFIGVLVLLCVPQTQGTKDNRQSFWDLWGSKSENTASVAGSEDFTLDTEGSGDDENKIGSTHADDEDFDAASGDGTDDLDETITLDKPTTTEGYYYEKDDTNDDEDFVEGSGSGEEPVEEEIVPINRKPVEAEKTTTTPKPLTPCENLRNSAMKGRSGYIPECDRNGEYKKLQCMVSIGKKEKDCWCVDTDGKIINGTKMKNEQPDCIYGENLKSCVFQRIQNINNLLGRYKPRCTDEGLFEPIQCQGSECWCVDHQGFDIPGTYKQKPEMPHCPDSLFRATLRFTSLEFTEEIRNAGDNIHELAITKQIKAALQSLFVKLPGTTIKIISLKEGSVIAEFVVDTDGKHKGDAVLRLLTDTINSGKVGPHTVSTEGFEFHRLSTPLPKELDEPPVEVDMPGVTPKIKSVKPDKEPGYTIKDTDDSKEKPDKPDIIVNEIPIDEEEEPDLSIEEEETNEVDRPYAVAKHNEPILAQPGLLAAIIGGAVVGLLCMVLLVMFIVYRMRKKDEGSYPLDEQKYQNYSYTKAPDKEFYA